MRRADVLDVVMVFLAAFCVTLVIMAAVRRWERGREAELRHTERVRW